MDAPPPSPSLLDQLRRGGGTAPAAQAWRTAGLIAALLAAGPLLTVVGAEALAMRASDDAARAAMRASGARPDGRDSFAKVLRRPGLAATLEGIARALPRDAVLQRVERGEDGRLVVEVMAPDPDRLRGALRRDPVTASLRDAGQRAGEGGMVVTLEDAR
jgi:hypothetical protein